MDQDSNNMSEKQLENIRQIIAQEMMDKHRSNKRKEKNDSGSDEDVGCMAMLKKISCTLNCGGSTCSIKETEHTSGSTTPSVSPSVSVESIYINKEQMPDSVSLANVQPMPIPTPAPKSRKRPVKKQMEANQSPTEQDSTAPAVKKVRRSSKKKQPPQVETPAQ